ncbi:MAG TPA: HEAT repeat domain-containing protein [Sphingobacteriaceae bacterium]
MKKLLLSLALAFNILTAAVAQNGVTSDISRIGSILSKMPAQDAVQFETQMNAVTGLGEDGLLTIISMFSDETKKDKSKLEYTINGYATYVTKSGNEELRKKTVNALCKGLSALNDKESKFFIITQLEIVGKDDAISCLQSYLNDERLADPAARVLVRINSAASNAALLQALQQAQGSVRISLIEALGDTRYTPVVQFLQPLVSSEDKNLAKVSIYALANIADPSSEKILSDAAQKAGFTYDITHATSNYIVYAQNLASNGHQAQAVKIAEEIMRKSNFDKGVHTRIAALKLLADIQKEQSIAALLNASVDKHPEYRAAALKFAADYLTPANSRLWIKKIKTADPGMQAAIITMLGDNKSKTAFTAILKLLKSNNKQVKLAAIKAAGKIGQQESLKPLHKVMKKGDEQDAEAVKNALLIMKGDDVTDIVARSISDMPGIAQVKLITVLSRRGEPDKLQVIYPLLTSKDASVRKAAFGSLKYLVTKDQLNKLFTLFNESSDYNDLMELQDAIITSMKDDKSTSYDALILQQVESAASNKKMFYYKILAYLGGEKPLQIVSDAFNSGDEKNKAAALRALTLWTNSNAADKLFAISKETNNVAYFNEAIKGYIKAVSISAYTQGQKFTMLSNAMAIAKTSDQKDLILREMEKTKIYPAMIFAGKYLDDPELQQRAGITIMNIALSNKSFYGKTVRELLNRTILVLKGRDGEFQKQSIRKHLSELPEGEPAGI